MKLGPKEDANNWIQQQDFGDRRTLNVEICSFCVCAQSPCESGFRRYKIENYRGKYWN